MYQAASRSQQPRWKQAPRLFQKIHSEVHQIEREANSLLPLYPFAVDVTESRRLSSDLSLGVWLIAKSRREQQMGIRIYHLKIRSWSSEVVHNPSHRKKSKSRSEMKEEKGKDHAYTVSPFAGPPTSARVLTDP